MEGVEMDYINSEAVEDKRKGMKDREKHDSDSGIRVYKVVGVSFGLLCVLQASLNVSLRLLPGVYQFCDKCDDQLSYNTSLPLDNDARTLVLERDRLRKQRDQLQTSYNQIQTRYKQLQTSKNALTKERDRLRTSYDDCLRADGTGNALVERYNALARDRDLLRDKVSQLSNEMRTLQEERDRLRARLFQLEYIAGPGSARVQSCPTGWTSHQSSCYLVSSEQKGWEEAKQDCLERGAHLVVINSREEQVALGTINRAPDGTVWIGLTDADTEGSWTWVDGTPLTTQYWASSQPDNGRRLSRADEDCTCISRGNPTLASWSDAPCDMALRWMCEKAIK